MRALLEHFVYWHWFAFAVSLIIIDVALGAQFFFVWSGFAAALVGTLMVILPTLPWEYQWLIFGVGVLMSLIVWRFYARRLRKATELPYLNRRAEQYLGRVFTLKEPLINYRGKISLEGAVWQIQGSVNLPAGTTVQVVAVRGSILMVALHSDQSKN